MKNMTNNMTTILPNRAFGMWTKALFYYWCIMREAGTAAGKLFKYSYTAMMKHK